MAYIRVVFLILALLGFYVLGVPLQRLARRHGWPLARSMTLLPLMGEATTRPKQGEIA